MLGDLGTSPRTNGSPRTVLLACVWLVAAACSQTPGPVEPAATADTQPAADAEPVTDATHAADAAPPPPPTLPFST